ncbi:GatB/YqeY domain-containing protein [Aeromicrobium alkaliterrae]|uniref:GatB/YqeY domain-containing protein n=1 Tax=Aeromicrobium alkaliterrae TaxID=302168 RepID=A0ABN2K3Q3_9ACTN
MSALKERLRSDLTTALKAREALTASTIRLVLAAISTAEVAGTQARELNDEEVLDIVVKEAKKRRESATAFDDGGRPEMAQKERDEAEILAAYLPAGLSDAEVAAIVTAAIEQTGAAGEGMKAMGKVMGLVQPQVKGRADGGAVAAEVKRQLGA